MFNQTHDWFNTLFHHIEPVVTKPVYKIRCNYRQVDAIGMASFLLPYEYTSEVNCKTSFDVLRNLGEDSTLLVRKHHGDYNVVLGSITFQIEPMRG